jgi:hypothetical protein
MIDKNSKRTCVSVLSLVVGVCAAILFAEPAVATTTINVPPDAAPASISGNTTLNLSSGGTLPDNFIAGFGTTLNIQSGRIGSGLGLIQASSSMAGGVVGPKFTANGGQTTLIGTNFQINGVPVSGLSQVGDTVPMVGGPVGVLTGTLADGTPIAINRLGDSFNSSNLVLQLSAPPPAGPALINVPGDPLPLGVNNGQTINVNAGAVVPTSFRAGNSAVVNVNGGSLAGDFEVISAQVNLASGSIADGFSLYNGSKVTINGGSIGDNMLMVSGGTLQMNGGTIGVNANVGNSTVQLLGGTTGGDFIMLDTQATVAGGSVGSYSTFAASDQSHVLTMTSGSIGDHFTIDGADIQQSFATINMSGGHIGPNLSVGYGGVVNLSGGAIGDSATDHGLITMTGGSLGNNMSVISTLKVEGGSVGSNLTLFAPSATLNYSGGSIAPGLHFGSGAIMNITGTSFLIGGQTVPGLVNVGDSVLLTHQQLLPLFGEKLTGTVLDGTAFSFDLNPSGGSGMDNFWNATVRLTLAPEPSSVVMGVLGALGLVALCRGRRIARRRVE